MTKSLTAFFCAANTPRGLFIVSIILLIAAGLIIANAYSLYAVLTNSIVYPD